jgi:tetratricopeptide (TPR) repeat protein
LDLRQARHLEKAGDYSRALKVYERCAERLSGERQAEALERAGAIYAGVFGRCDRAVPLFERAARLGPFPDAKNDWPAEARAALLECPDLFPLRPGSRWTYVDSASGGANMRLEVSVSTEGSRVSGAYFAGKQRFRGYDRSYDKADWALWETEGRERRPILRYPFRAGRSWSGASSGRKLEYTIEADGVLVRVKAGAFKDCIKVRARPVGEPAWVYEYFCPGVGRAKTTIGTSEGENPNTELSFWEPAARPSAPR